MLAELCLGHMGLSLTVNMVYSISQTSWSMEIADGISVHSFLLQDAATVGRVAEKADIVIPVATGKNHLLCL